MFIKQFLSCTLGTTLEVVLFTVYVFPTRTKGTAGALYCVRGNYAGCVKVGLWLRGVSDRVHQRLVACSFFNNRLQRMEQIGVKGNSYL